jgi:hypothetical protein
MKGFKEVTKKEFYEFVMPNDFVYSAEGNSPYTGIHKTRSGQIVAKQIPHGKHIGVMSDEYKYYLLQS